MNTVQLIGRLTRNPILKETQSGHEFTRFTLAVDRRGEGADFISCLAWNKTAELICNYLSQGNKVAITGRIQTGSYTDKDGKTHYTTEVVADSMEFVDSKKNEVQQDDNDNAPVELNETSSKGKQQSLPQPNEFGWMNAETPEFPF